MQEDTALIKVINHLNGEQALAFCRERKSFAAVTISGAKPDGSYKGMINKALSPAILTNYNAIMNSVADGVDTNMSTREITSLVKMIDDMSPGP